MMIVVSDNLCTGLVADLVGLDRVNAFCQRVGLTRTHHRESVPRDGRSVGGKSNLPLETMNATTPNDQARLFHLTVDGAAAETPDSPACRTLGVVPELCRLALSILSRQKLVGRMPVRLPREVKIAHKTGTNEGRNYHDGGVVYAGGAPRFILTVYTERVPETLPNGEAGSVAASALIAELTRTCWDAMSGR